MKFPHKPLRYAVLLAANLGQSDAALAANGPKPSSQENTVYCSTSQTVVSASAQLARTGDQFRTGYSVVCMGRTPEGALDSANRSRFDIPMQCPDGIGVRRLSPSAVSFFCTAAPQ